MVNNIICKLGGGASPVQCRTGGGMSQGVIPTHVSEIKYLQTQAVEVPQNSQRVAITATIPEGFRFLCWTSFTTSGFVVATNMTLTQTPTTAILWFNPYPSTSGTAVGNYIVCR